MELIKAIVNKEKKSASLFNSLVPRWIPCKSKKPSKGKIEETNAIAVNPPISWPIIYANG